MPTEFSQTVITSYSIHYTKLYDNGDAVDALSLIVHADKAQFRGRELVSKMREFIPRQQYEVAIQAAIGNNVVARETRNNFV